MKSATGREMKRQPHLQQFPIKDREPDDQFRRAMHGMGVVTLRDDFQQWRKCYLKVRHVSDQAAKNARCRMRNGTGLESYFCEHCFGYHLGHVNKVT